MSGRSQPITVGACTKRRLDESDGTADLQHGFEAVKLFEPERVEGFVATAFPARNLQRGGQKPEGKGRYPQQPEEYKEADEFFGGEA